jgi:DNA polymerase III delta prime subunit
MTAYLDRLVDALVAEFLRQLPAVLIVGPRAVGKTTTALRFARTVIRLDRDADAAAFRADPDVALHGLQEPVLLDEWQVVPSVLGALKRAVDDDPRPGRFLLTGSVRADIEADTWPGTGRLVRVAMSGLVVREVIGNIGQPGLFERIVAEGVEAAARIPTDTPDLKGYIEMALAGSFPSPALHLQGPARRRWLDGYLDQILTRDAAQVAGDLCSVTRQDLVEVSVQPAPPGWALQMQGWAWKRSGERHLDVALQVRGVGRDPSSRFDTLGHDPLEESGLTNVADDFTHDQTGHGDSHQPARSRPRVGLDVGADRARQQESAGPRVVVHRPLERAEDRRYDLPLIQKDRLLEAMKGDVRISAKGGRVGVAVKPDDRASESQSRGGLADSTRTDDQHSGKLAKELGYESVDKSVQIRRHAGMIPISRSSNYQHPANPATNTPHSQIPRCPA